MTQATETPNRAVTTLRTLGWIGLGAALAFLIGGWILASRAAGSVEATIEPTAAMVSDMSEAIAAGTTMVTTALDAIEETEATIRSSARAVASIADAADGVAILIEDDIAGSLDSAVQTLPSLIDTARLVDRTMTALSFIGVDYDPDTPLDESLEDLESALQPLPQQLRDQAAEFSTVTGDLRRISTDAGQLAATLLEARIELMDAEAALESAAENAIAASGEVTEIASQLDSYLTLARIVVVAAAVALGVASATPLLIANHLDRVDST